MTLNKASIEAGLVTRAELDQIIAWLSESLPLDSQGRVRNVQLIARAHAITCAHKMGRGERTSAFLRSIAQPVPRLWAALDEQEADQERLEEDLLLTEGARLSRTPNSHRPC